MTSETLLMLVGLVTAMALAAGAGIVCAYAIKVNRHRRKWGRNLIPKICLYLDEKSALDIYLQGEYPALQRSVQRTTHRNSASGLLLRIPLIRGTVDRAVKQEQIEKYFEDAGSITTIGRIIHELDGARDIVYVDLIERTIGMGAGLNRVLEQSHGKGAKRASAPLRELETAAFVSVKGRFWVTDQSETTTTFSATYGNASELSGDLPKVGVTADTAWLRHEKIPQSPFIAHCLGKIRWDPGTGELEIYPILAIFL
ncbi:hypothetical protein [Spirillospora sp. NPDC048819]|uniref:hypothetical protein n=1 Tax=Spirillospora sp. NPDC048819 TaxID=3155268 RepID=UPI0033D89D9A